MPAEPFSAGIPPLRKLGVLCRIVKVLSPFHMVDVEAARKVCEYFLN